MSHSSVELRHLTPLKSHTLSNGTETRIQDDQHAKSVAVAEQARAAAAYCDPETPLIRKQTA